MGSNDFYDCFTMLSMANVGIWDTGKRRTAYTGYAFRAGLAADSGAPLQILVLHRLASLIWPLMWHSAPALKRSLHGTTKAETGSI